MDIVNSIFLLLAGIGVFLGSIKMLTSTLRRNSLKTMNTLFKRVGENRFVGVGVGAAVTTVTQSSTAVTVMTVSFVNLGILTLLQATAIIMGANLGTTLTSFFVAFGTLNIGNVFMSLAFFGLVMQKAFKRDKVKFAGEVLMLIGILFAGMHIMGRAFRGNEDITTFFSTLFETISFPLWLILFGIVFTIILQSSTATMAVYITMVSEGVMPFETAIFLVLGTEVGTCFTAMISAIGQSTNAKRAAFAHLFYNIFGTVLFASIVWPLKNYIVPLYTNLIADPVWQVAAFPFVNNVISVALLIWFIKPFNRFICWLVKDTQPSEQEALKVSFTDESLLRVPLVAYENARKGITYMGLKARENSKRVFEALITANTENKEKILNEEDKIDDLAKGLGSYLIKLSSVPTLHSDKEMILASHHAVNNIERIADHSISLLYYTERIKEKNISLSSKTIDELTVLFNKIKELFNLSLKSLYRSNKVRKEANALKREIDAFSTNLASSHIERMYNDESLAAEGDVFNKINMSLVNIADNLSNIVNNVPKK
ncbi:MAG: Na/Pi symporter [Firmicutes bacterium]|nr:Na/Pi symporter [Bacillota bacterium]